MNNKIYLVLISIITIQLITSQGYSDCSIYGICQPSSQGLTINQINQTLMSGNGSYWWTGSTSQPVGNSNKVGIFNFSDFSGNRSLLLSNTARVIFDLKQKQSAEFVNRRLITSSNIQTVSWGTENLYSNTGVTTFDWSNGLWYDNTGILGIVVQQGQRDLHDASGNSQVDFTNQNGTYFFKNVDIRGDALRLQDTALFVQSPDIVQECIGDITACSDLDYATTCSLFSGCTVGECQNNPTIDCSIFNSDEVTCNYYSNNYGGVCQPTLTYFDTCYQISSNTQCDNSASGYGCFWNGGNSICDGYDSSFGSCYSYTMSGQVDCENAGCYWDGGSSVCTRFIGNNIFSGCSNGGSCSFITGQTDCDYIGLGCTFNPYICVGTPSSTSCSQISIGSGYCSGSYTNNFCSNKTTNDLNNIVSRQGVGGTKNMYECQDSSGTVQTTINSNCQELNSPIITTSNLTVQAQSYFNNNINTKNIFPITSNLYTIGSGSNFYATIYGSNIFSANITLTDSVKSRNVNTTNITSATDNSIRINTTNITAQLMNISVINVTQLNVRNSTILTNALMNGNTNMTGNLSVKMPYFTGYQNTTMLFTNTSAVQVMNVSNNIVDNWLISVENQQNITFQLTGDYLIGVSPEFYQASENNKIITFWIQHWNGTEWKDVPWTNSRYSMQNGDYSAPFIPFQVDVTYPLVEKYRIMWYSDSLNSQIIAVTGLTNPTRPAIPSVILNIQKVSEIT